MGIVDTLKETVGLIQKVDNIDLYQKMLELQTQTVALVEENRALRDRLAVRDQLAFRRNAYWRGDDGPYCSRCWDDETKLIRLHDDGKWLPQCPKCHTVAERER